jgi:hypothetical protein
MFMRYVPRTNSIRGNKVSRVTVTGIDSNNANYIRATKALGSKLGCNNLEFSVIMMFVFGYQRNSLTPFKVL